MASQQAYCEYLVKGSSDGTGNKGSSDGTGNKGSSDGTGNKGSSDGTGGKSVDLNLLYIQCMKGWYANKLTNFNQSQTPDFSGVFTFFDLIVTILKYQLIF